MKLVQPKTFLIGYTVPEESNIWEYLHYTGQIEFVDAMKEARNRGVSWGEILCSFYAKLCYKSLSIGKNANLSKIRDIKGNFESIINQGHGAVLEHFTMNFVTTDCSRIYTHELVRHRVGSSYSQVSGRFVSLGVGVDPETGEERDVDIDFVMDPILEPMKDLIKDQIESLEKTLREMRRRLITKDTSFEDKKRITSAIRRLAPNGQGNEMGWSFNLRTIRQTIEVRTSRHAEWEIRLIFNQVAEIILERWPNMLYGHKRELVRGLYEYTNLKV